MIEVDSHTLVILGAASVAAIIVLQLLVAVYMFACLRVLSKDNSRLNKEMYGLLRRIEGLTAHKREQLLVQFDAILDTLSCRLPTTIASRASEAIFETEKDILTRLAELEPNLKENPEGKERLEGLVKKMERLEQTVVALASDTVQQVMIESRRELFDSEKSQLPGSIDIQ